MLRSHRAKFLAANEARRRLLLKTADYDWVVTVFVKATVHESGPSYTLQVIVAKNLEGVARSNLPQNIAVRGEDGQVHDFVVMVAENFK